MAASGERLHLLVEDNVSSGPASLSKACQGELRALTSQSLALQACQHVSQAYSYRDLPFESCQNGGERLSQLASLVLCSQPSAKVRCALEHWISIQTWFSWYCLYRALSCAQLLPFCPLLRNHVQAVSSHTMGPTQAMQTCCFHRAHSGISMLVLLMLSPMFSGDAARLLGI